MAKKKKITKDISSVIYDIRRGYRSDSIEDKLEDLFRTVLALFPKEKLIEMHNESDVSEEIDDIEY